jgi:hypothetical protein
MATMKAKLTPLRFNQLTAAALGSDGHGSSTMASLRKDWRAFLSEHFQLTATQQRNLSGLPAGEVALLQRAISTVPNGGAVRMEMNPDGGGRLVIGRTGWTIRGGICCTFTTGFSRLKCGPCIPQNPTPPTPPRGDKRGC